MAFWGEAMSLYHQLWVWPSEQTLKQGHDLLDRAVQAGAKTDREKRYIRAALAFYDRNPKTNRIARIDAYSSAMAGIHQSHPNDIDAAAFYALSLLALADEGKEGARTKAVEILTPLFDAAPDHPGVAHYLIHATDTPELAPMGLRAAQRYATIAPSSSHALHMPSHIFARLGLWPSSIVSNLASISAAADATRKGVDNQSGYQLHAMKYLEYAYLQLGKDSDADRVINEVRDIPGIRTDDVINDGSIMRAQYVMETHQWSGVGQVVLQPAATPFAKVRIYWSRIIAECHLGNTDQAEKEMEELRRIPTQSSTQESTGQSLEVLEAEAWLAFALGKKKEAEQQMRAAVNMDRFSVDEAGLPASELLGDLLLELKKPGVALDAYDAALKEAPNRFNSLYGAAQAAQLNGDHERAAGYFATLAKVADPGSNRSELQQARAFLQTSGKAPNSLVQQ